MKVVTTKDGKVWIKHPFSGTWLEVKRNKYVKKTINSSLEEQLITRS